MFFERIHFLFWRLNGLDNPLLITSLTSLAWVHSQISTSSVKIPRHRFRNFTLQFIVTVGRLSSPNKSGSHDIAEHGDN
jgi:hypothetical protein